MLNQPMSSPQMIRMLGLLPCPFLERARRGWPLVVLEAPLRPLPLFAFPARGLGFLGIVLSPRACDAFSVDDQNACGRASHQLPQGPTRKTRRSVCRDLRGEPSEIYQRYAPPIAGPNMCPSKKKSSLTRSTCRKRIEP